MAKPPKDQAVSDRLPVARVAVDISLAHLDRPFDYLVPARLDAAAVPGCRVRVRFAGQLVDGYLLDRAETSEHQGRLARLERVISPESVLTPEIFNLARAVADRYAGTLADVLRLAIPPRHATAERGAPAAPASAAPGPAATSISGAAPDAPGHAAPDAPAPAIPDAPARAAPDTAAGPVVPQSPGAAPDLAASRDSGAPPDAAVSQAAEASPVPQDSGASASAPDPGPSRPAPGSWTRYPAGPAFLAALAEGRPVRAAWSALPGPEWPSEIAIAAAATAASGRGVVIVVPDARDLARVDAALTEVHQGPGAHTCLTADLGPAERYRRWLAGLRGTVRIVAGTRAAMFAPVCHLGLVVLWDDGDDLHAEPRAPYPNAREVLALRAHRAGAAALIGGFARTTELTQLVESGWARPLIARPEVLRQVAPRVRAAPDEAELARDAAAMTARLPSLALRTARVVLTGNARHGQASPAASRDAQAGSREGRSAPGDGRATPATGPVLVQVPRSGYLAAVACSRCRAQARCTVCGGPLRVGGATEVPGCRWCGALAADWSCPQCGSGRLRALVTGAARTAEELGRAFPGVTVRTSGGQHVLAGVPAEPALVIATPGAEPVAEEGYAAALLLDGWALLSRPSLRAAEETLRRWLNAAALVRPAGAVVVLAESSLSAVQALLRWDPAGFAERELAERAELGFPPAVRMAAVTGPAAALADFLASAELPARAEILGPVPAEPNGAEPGAEPGERALIRVPRPDGLALARTLHAAQAVRSARKDGGVIRVQLDPAEVA